MGNRLNYQFTHLDNLFGVMKVSIVLHPKYITDEIGNRISVVLPIEEFEVLTRIQASEDETAYLLKSPANAKRLLESLANIQAGRNIEQHELLPDD